MSEPPADPPGEPAMRPGEPPGEPAMPPGDPGTPAPRHRIGRWWWAVGIAIAALVVVVVVPFASSDPDGLERVAEDQGFLDRAQNLVEGLLGGYAIPGIDDPAVTTVLSGLLGIAIVVLAMVVLGRLVVRRRA